MQKKCLKTRNAKNALRQEMQKNALRQEMQESLPRSVSIYCKVEHHYFEYYYRQSFFFLFLFFLYIIFLQQQIPEITMHYSIGNLLYLIINQGACISYTYLAPQKYIFSFFKETNKTSLGQ